MNLIAWIVAVVALLVGFVIGRVLTRITATAPAELAQLRQDAATATALAGEARQDAANARAEAATARTETAQTRTELAMSHTEVERARADAATAAREAAVAQAGLAEVNASTRAIEVERDAAVARVAELTADREAMAAQFKALSNEALERQGRLADESAVQRLVATEQVMAPVKETLTRFESRLTEVEKERTAMAADLRAQVQAVQLTGEQLRRETSSLSTALRKPQVRGSWGEMQLKSIIESAGMTQHCDFVLQATTTTDERTIRPDLKVNLGEGRFIYVDSKVPLTSFMDAQEATDDAERARCLAQFGRNVRSHIDQLGAKQYWKADLGTPEFVILFIPTESLHIAAIEQVRDLHEYAGNHQIVIAGPSTLIAVLRAVSQSWRQAALAESAREVSALGRELYDRLATMGTHFDKVGRGLLSSVKAYNSAAASLEGRVLVTARKFRDLHVTDADLPSPSQLDQTVKQLSAPELLEDASPAMLTERKVEPLVGRGRRGELDAVAATTEDDLVARQTPSVDELAAAEAKVTVLQPRQTSGA